MSVRVDVDGDLALVTIDRPHRRNALDRATLLELTAHWSDLAATTRVVVVTGSPPAFCAGADLDGVDGGTYLDLLGTMLRGVTTLRIPVIAAIDGPALGAGMQLALACDLRVATAASVFGIPAAKLGLVVDRWTVERLGQEVGWPTARAMLLGAETRDGRQLAEAGAIHRIGDLDVALAWARDLAEMAPLTLAAHKLTIEHAVGRHASDRGAAIDVVEAARAAVWASADAEEGRQAFLEKRPARFTGR